MVSTVYDFSPRRLVGYATGDKKQPKPDDPNSKHWVLLNFLTISLLFNWMDPTLVSSYIPYDTAAGVPSSILILTAIII